MHRKDDRYSPKLFLDAENDVPAYKIVSAQKSFALSAGRNSGERQASAISAARTWSMDRVPQPVPTTNSTKRHIGETRQQNRTDNDWQPNEGPVR
jgi:hypothetical protein